jgi:DNA-binding CsgD family transcriptional regulator
MDDALVGRGPELVVLGDFLTRSAADGGALLLTGEPGVGKTALLQAAAARAAQADTRVLQTAGSAVEMISFSGLTQVVMPLLAYDDCLSADQREAVSVALGLADGRPPQPAAISQAVLALLRAVARQVPILIVVDDLQWLDLFSGDVLRFVARRVPGSRIGVLAASRPPAPGHLGLDGVPSHHLAALDPVASDVLLRARFPALPPRVRHRLLDEAAGNPLALLELPSALSGRELASVQELPDVLPLSERLQAIFAARVTQLPPATQDLLLLAALDATGDLHVLRAAAGVPVLDDLAPAERERIIYVDVEQHRVTFRHPLTRSAVAGLSTATSRCHAHEALARALADQPEHQARHLAAATDQPDEGIATRLEQCARHMAHRGNATGAIAALTRAADLSPGAGDRRRRLAEAAYIGSDLTWQLPASITPPGRAPDAEPEAAGALHLAAAAAAAAVTTGSQDIDTIHRHLLAAMEAHSGSGDPADDGMAAAVTTLTTVCLFGGRAELWDPCRAALARLGSATPRGVRLQAGLQGNPAHEALPLLPALDAAIASLHRETDQDELLRIPAAAVFVDRVGACRDILRRQVAGGPETTTARATVAKMYLWTDAFAAGRWDEAQQLADDCLAACLASGGAVYAQIAKYHTAILAGVHGDQEKVDALAGELADWATSHGTRQAHTFAWHAKPLAATGRGDFEIAYQKAAAISPAGTFAPYEPLALWACPDLVEGAVATGRRAAARAHADAMNRHRLADISPRLALITSSCAAMAADDDHEAARLFDRALSVPAADRWVFDYARVQLAYAQRLRRIRESREARRHLLRAALGTFDTIGARPWADRAARELRAVGPGRTSPAGGDVTGPGALTHHELKVAQLAAAGYTNKQIGEHLHLSPRTVSTHLYRIFPKLGITTRAALRDALTRDAR